MAIDERTRMARELDALGDRDLRQRAEAAGVEHQWRARRAVIAELVERRVGGEHAGGDGSAGGRDDGAGDEPPARKADGVPEDRVIDRPPSGAAPAAGTRAPAPAAGEAPPDTGAREAVGPSGGTSHAGARDVVRLPAASPFAPIGGWLVAWGAAALAAAILIAAEIDLGLGLGIAGATQDQLDLSAAVSSPDFLPSLWLLAVQFGAFLVGGYAAARLARTRGTTHAAGAWLLAMLATAVDAIVAAVRDAPQAIQALTLPTWVNNGLALELGTVAALAVFALASLLGALAGGALGQAANGAARMEVDEASIRR